VVTPEKEKSKQETHPGSLSLSCGEKSGCGREEVSGKTHGVGVGEEKQAGKPTPEACC